MEDEKGGDKSATSPPTSQPWLRLWSVCIQAHHKDE